MKEHVDECGVTMTMVMVMGMGGSEVLWLFSKDCLKFSPSEVGMDINPGSLALILLDSALTWHPIPTPTPRLYTWHYFWMTARRQTLSFPRGSIIFLLGGRHEEFLPAKISPSFSTTNNLITITLTPITAITHLSSALGSRSHLL
jgi:hypothetical protein